MNMCARGSGVISQRFLSASAGGGGERGLDGQPPEPRAAVTLLTPAEPECEALSVKAAQWPRRHQLLTRRLPRKYCVCVCVWLGRVGEFYDTYVICMNSNVCI